MGRNKQSNDIDGDYWNQFRNYTDKPSEAIFELVDNSVDAGANTITINLDNDALEIVDNGEGMSRDGLLNMFKLGGSTRRGNVNASGRYGHGSKVGLAHFGNVFHITTVNGGLRSALKWNTEEDIASGIWKKGLRMSGPKKVKAKPGTKIRVTEKRKPRLPKYLKSHLEFQFSPAIESGVKIIFNGEEVKPQTPPWLGSPQTATGDVDGMRYTMTFGRLQSEEDAPGASKWQGVHSIKLARFVNDISSWRDPVDGTPLCCVVRLHVSKKTDWQLNPVKTGLASADVKDELERCIRETCRDEILRYQQEDKTLETRALENVLNGIASVFKKAAEDGKAGMKEGGEARELAQGNGRGGVDRQGETKPRKLKPDEGDTHNGQGGLIEFQFADIGDDFYSVKFDKGTGRIVVRFNTKSPAYDQQKPDHVMYIVTAALGIAAKMRETKKLEDHFPEWRQYMEENQFSMESYNADSRFCKWFQDKTLGVVHEQAA